MYEDNGCYKNKSRCCIDTIIYVLSVIFTFVIGVIVGTFTTLGTILTLGSLIVLAVILFILIIIRIIAIICKRKC